MTPNSYSYVVVTSSASALKPLDDMELIVVGTAVDEAADVDEAVSDAAAAIVVSSAVDDDVSSDVVVDGDGLVLVHSNFVVTRNFGRVFLCSDLRDYGLNRRRGSVLGWAQVGGNVDCC